MAKKIIKMREPKISKNVKLKSIGISKPHKKIEYKKIRDKGQFFSLTTFLIILFLIVTFALIANMMNIEEKFNTDRLEKTSMNNFVSDFDRIYVTQMIGSAIKPAVAGILRRDIRVNKGEFVRIIEEGDSTFMDSALSVNNTFKNVLSTTTFYLSNSTKFNLELVSVDQDRSDTLKFLFSVNYTFVEGNTVWSRDRQVTLYMDIYNLNHPAYNHSQITTDWIHANADATCFSNQVFTDAQSCIGQNLRPPIYN